MRLKAHFYLKKDTSSIAYAKHGFKTRNYTAQCKELQNFEKDLLDTIKLIKFQLVKDSFQRKLKEDISNIKSSPEMHTFVDKSTNIYNCLRMIIKSYYIKISPNPIKDHQPVWKNL